MIIGIDARLALREPRGIGKYILNVLRALAEVDSENQYILYTDKEDHNQILPLKFSRKVLSSKNYFFWEQLLLPRAATRDGIDLLHCMANTAPVHLNLHTKLVMTIHDVMYMHNSDEVLDPGNLYQRFGRLYRRMIVPCAAQSACEIVTVSNSSRDEIRNYIGLQNIPILVNYQGCDFAPDPNSKNLAALKEHYGISRNYILSMGGIAPRKNTKGMLKIFSSLVKKYDIQLVVISIPRAGRGKYIDYAKEVGVEKSVVFLDFVPEDELHLLMSHSILFLYLSLFEGFGLPVVEAMKCGTPVVASNLTSIPEIAGDGAILVDPKNENEAIDAMIKIITEPAARIELSQKGLERSKIFSWRSNALKLVECYRRAYSESKKA